MPTVGVGRTALPGRLVVERHVPRDHRNLERPARLRHPFKSSDELPHDPRVLGLAEVEAVGDPDRLGADARQVADRLGHRLGRAVERVEAAGEGVAVGRGGDADARAREQQQRRVRPRADHRARTHRLVVLLPHRGASANAGLASSARRSVAPASARAAGGSVTGAAGVGASQGRS